VTEAAAKGAAERRDADEEAEPRRAVEGRVEQEARPKREEWHIN